MSQDDKASGESPIPPPSQYANCPKCNELEPNPAQFVRPKRLTDVLEVKLWPELTRKTEWKHSVDEGARVAYYKVTQLIECSLGHDHKQGSIVKTRCGLIILLGWKCANDAVHGYDTLSKEWKEAEAHFDRVDRVKRIPFECIDKLEEFIPELTKANHFRDAKKPTGLGQEMLRRATSGSPRAAEITVKARVFGNTKATDLGGVNVVEVDTTEVVQGLAFWTKDFAIERAHRLLHEAKELGEIARGMDAENASNADVVALNQRCISLETSTRHVEETVVLCRTFLTKPNLERANTAFTQRPSV